ncbi:hypothetical protein A2U01_0066033, partial [Trifolium medium]|nr:hypothetical protein [Trifolium medium]
ATSSVKCSSRSSNLTSCVLHHVFSATVLSV